MAKNNKEQLPDVPDTMEDYMLQQLKKTVILKDGNTLKDPHDGHELTAEEAIAHNMINAAMKGDVKAAQYIQNIQMRAKIMKIRAPFTQGGGLRRGCGIAA